jgi:glycosyltransferase involved in cell wall biosynthesis
VQAEASVRGIPVIGTNVDGINEIILNNRTGFLVEVDDDARMIRCIYKLIYDDQLWNYFSLEGRRHIKNKYNIEDNVLKFKNVYSHYDKL